MKTTLWILPILLLAACDKKYCWNCELRTTTIVVTNATDSVLTSETKQEEVCDHSKREIEIRQNERTDETVTENNGIKTHKLFMYSCQKE